MIRRRRIAQLVEQGVDNAQVRGSSPFGSRNKIERFCLSENFWSMAELVDAADC